MPTVHILDGTGHATVYSPFEAKDTIKSLPTHRRSWSAGEKCWRVDTDAVDDLADMLRSQGFDVVLVDTDTHWIRSDHVCSAPPPPPPRTNGNWAEQLLRTAGPELSSKIRQQLSRALHPDTGGSTALMQDLNHAYDIVVRKANTR